MQSAEHGGGYYSGLLLPVLAVPLMMLLLTVLRCISLLILSCLLVLDVASHMMHPVSSLFVLGWERESADIFWLMDRLLVHFEGIPKRMGIKRLSLMTWYFIFQVIVSAHRVYLLR